MNFNNVLAWYDSIGEQNHYKWWTYGQKFCLTTPIDYLIPFQIIRAVGTGAPITEFKIIRHDDGTETDILALANFTGLEVLEYVDKDYDNIFYPGVQSLLLNLEMGYYYLKISDGSTAFTKYSEVFHMTDDVSEMIKIEFWHLSDFCFKDGHLDYKFPYKSTIYIQSDIGKPTYPYKEKVIENAGYVKHLQQTSYKLNKFMTIAPEYLLDFMRTIRLHDHVFIYYKNQTFDVDEFLMTDPKWLQNGDVAETVFEFKTDTVIEVSARGHSNLDYEAAAGACLMVDYNCVAFLVEGSPHYTGNYYFEPDDRFGTNPIPLAADDSVLVRDATVTSEIRVERFNGLSYVVQSLSVNEIAYDANEDGYYFVPTAGGTMSKPFISSYSNIGVAGKIFGESFPGTRVEVFQLKLVGAVLTETKIAEGTAAEFVSGSGIAFPFDGDILKLKVKSSSAVCQLFEESEYYDVAPSGIGVMIIETDNIVG